MLNYYRNDPLSRTEIQSPSTPQYFIEESTALIESLNKFRKGEPIEPIVEAIYRLKETHDTHSLISKIPAAFLDPTLREALLDILKKVSRYRESVASLYQISKGVPIVRTMRFVAVKLPAKAFTRVSASECNPAIRQVVATLPQAQLYQQKIKKICKVLADSEAGADAKLSKQTQKTLQEARIHAEIQLIYYCELHVFAGSLWPRVVRSSKNACWLCNTFISSHGRMYTSKCHGRLYPGWRLPLLVTPGHVTDSFDMALRRQISESLDSIIGGRRSTFPFPDESTLSLVRPKVSALVVTSDVAPLPSAVEETTKEPLRHADQLEAQTTVDLGIWQGEHSTSQTPMAGRERDVSVTKVGSDVPNPHPHSQISTDSFVSNSRSIRTSKAKSRFFLPGETSPMYTAGNLEVQVEYAGGSAKDATGDAGGKLSCKMEKLSLDAAAVVEKDPSIRIVDAESLGKDELPCQAGEPVVIYLRGGGSMLRITLGRL